MTWCVGHIRDHRNYGQANQFQQTTGRVGLRFHTMGGTRKRDDASLGMKTKRALPTDQAEMHRSGRAGWLRAAVLGSDDAIVSTASLMIGVAASAASTGAILVAGVAGLVAG